LLLFESLKHVGIALATSIAAWANVLLLAIFLARRGHFSLDAREWKQQALIVVLTVLMGGALWLAVAGLGPVFDPGYPFLIQALALLVLCVGGAGLYFALVHLSGVQRLGLLLKRLRMKRISK
ncbi:MAG: lipid II flippase MurJ, partial [Hyphomicrobiales bacterium]